MLVSEAKTALKAYGFDDTDPLNIWLEAGKELVESADNWPWLFKQVTIAATANLVGVSAGSAPAIPGDYFKPFSLRDVTDKRKLKWVDPQAWDRDIVDPTQSGIPELYTEIQVGGTAPGIQLRWWPVPAVAWSLLLTYQANLGDIITFADGVSMPGPDSIHYPTVQAAAAIALQVDNEEERATTAQAEFNESIGRLRRKFFARVDEPRTVQDVMGYGG